MDDVGIQKEINDLAKKWNGADKVTHIVPFAEFCDGFLPHKSLTANEGLLLHAFTLQARDSTFDNAKCTHPIELVHKTKDNVITERSYINDMDKRENPVFPFMVYSKK